MRFQYFISNDELNSPDLKNKKGEKMINKKYIITISIIMIICLFFGIRQFNITQYNNQLEKIMKLNVCENVLAEELIKINDAKKEKNIKKLQLQLMQIHIKRFFILKGVKDDMPKSSKNEIHEKMKQYYRGYMAIKNISSAISENEEKEILENSNLEGKRWVKLEQSKGGSIHAIVLDFYLEAMDNPVLIMRTMTKLK